MGMTKEKFKREMQNIISRNDDDWESAHYQADKLIIKLLIELGYNDGAEIFDDMPKWYS